MLINSELEISLSPLLLNSSCIKYGRKYMYENRWREDSKARGGVKGHSCIHCLT